MNTLNTLMCQALFSMINIPGKIILPLAVYRMYVCMYTPVYTPVHTRVHLCIGKCTGIPTSHGYNGKDYKGKKK